jgi:hypothetical protein
MNQGHKDFLGHIFRRRIGSAHQSRESVDHRPVPLIDRRERRTVACRRALDELDVGRRRHPGVIVGCGRKVPPIRAAGHEETDVRGRALDVK